MSEKIAVVTGANRGIGQEIVRQLARRDVTVVATSRNRDGAADLESGFAAEGLTVRHFPLEVTDSEDRQALTAFLQAEYGGLDILVNNAGILLEGDRIEPPVSPHILDTDLDRIRQTFETNTLAPLALALECIPWMRKRGGGRIVNLSSGMGSMAEGGTGYPAYRVSKVALNMITRLLAAEVRGENILVNAVCPGWVRTDMGGPNATRTLEQGAYGPVRLALLPDGGPSGGFFRDDAEVPW